MPSSAAAPFSPGACKARGPRALAIASVLDEGEVETLFSGAGYGPAALSGAERAAVAAPPAGEAPAHVKGEYPKFLKAN